MLAALDGVVHGSAWEGPDAENFRERFVEARRRGSETSQTLAERGQELRRQAEEQDEVSQGDGGGGSTGQPGGGGGAPRQPGGGTSPGIPGGSGGSWDPIPDWMNDVLDSMRTKGIGRIVDYFAHDPWGRRMKSMVPLLSIIPEVGDLIQHAKEGDIGSGISDIGSIALSLVPGPAAEIAGDLNTVSPAFMPQGKSLMDWGGDMESHGLGVQQGEMVGSSISEGLGFGHGTTADNVTRTSAAIGAYVFSKMNPVSGIANSVSGAWNMFR